MTYPTEAELGMMDAFVEAGLALNPADCRALLAESRRLRSLLQMAWNLIHTHEVRTSAGAARDFDRLWLACIELGIVTLTPAQVQRFRQMPFEPYRSAVRLYQQRNQDR